MVSYLLIHWKISINLLINSQKHFTMKRNNQYLRNNINFHDKQLLEIFYQIEIYLFSLRQSEKQTDTHTQTHTQTHPDTHQYS